MAISVKKSSYNELFKALSQKRTVGALSEERIEIRKSINSLKVDDIITFDLPVADRKETYHPLLEKIRAETKSYNDLNSSDGVYLVLYTQGNEAHVTLHNYKDIESCLKEVNGNLRVNISLYKIYVESRKSD
jgi:hypothetical protein